MNDLHGIIFSYERPNALRELIEPRVAASIPFGGRFRAVDFVLSNMVNAGITDVGVVMHGKYQSLLDHLGTGKDWDLSRRYGGLKLLPLSANAGTACAEDFHGRIAALYGVMSYLQEIRQEYVVMADCDVVVNLPIRDVLAQHIATGADVTVVCTADLRDAENCSCFKLDDSGRIVETAYNQHTPSGYRSLEIFLLSTKKLIELVEDCISRDVTSWRQGVLQGKVHELRLQAYVWDGYAAQIRSIKQYYDRSMELLQSSIRKELFRPDRPIRAKDSSNLASYVDENCRCVNSLIADGCDIEGNVENSILFPGVKIGKGAEVKNCILFKDTSVGAGTVLHYAIVDKNSRILAGRTLMGHENYPIVVGKDLEV
ncbi:MAG: glucose-1-phosphate adenylyltransferase subunit GlgD [Oscillospiraceae bacterium]